MHRTQLPLTCGACHPRQSTAFRASRHGTVLASGEARAPSCSTCHGAMSAAVPSPTGLERTCGVCHADASRDAYPSDARVVTEWMADARARLHDAELAIARVADDTTRRQLWWRYDRAVDRTNQAAVALHAFDLQAARVSLALVRAELAAITQQVAAGPS